jgi:hypothetical protein
LVKTLRQRELCPCLVYPLEKLDEGEAVHGSTEILQVVRVFSFAGWGLRNAAAATWATLMPP